MHEKLRRDSPQVGGLSNVLDAIAPGGGFVHRLNGNVALTANTRPGLRDEGGIPAVSDAHSILQDIADALVIVALSNTVGFLYHWAVGKHPGINELTYTGVMIAGTFVAAGRLFNGRSSWEGKTRFKRFKEAVQCWTIAFAVLWFVLFAFKAGEMFSRGAVLAFYLGGLPVIGLWRVASEPALRRLARTGYSHRDAIVICDAEDRAADGFVNELVAMGYPSPIIVACPGFSGPAMSPAAQKNLVARVFAAARTCREGEIFLCAGTAPAERLASLERALSILPRALFVVPEAQTASLVRCKPKAIGGYVAVEVQREPLASVERICKRVMDIVLSAALLLLLAPSLLMVAVAIKLDSAGPVFFRQNRNGHRGQPFRIFKFRTMHVLEDGQVVQQARRDDTRITRVGRFLRRTSIDELPQLLNVLFGDMSLVGPRPHANAHDDFYSKVIENYEVRQHVKPGMTGWAQVNGLRGETRDIQAMYRRIEYDLWYALNASILFDCEILLRTAAEVFRQRNAY